jgi:hypothetical protein
VESQEQGVEGDRHAERQHCDRPLASPLGRQQAGQDARQEDVAVAEARGMQVEVLQLRTG